MEADLHRREQPAPMVYFMLTRGEAFVDPGQQRHKDQQRQPSDAVRQRRAAALGLHTNPVGAAV